LGLWLNPAPPPLSTRTVPAADQLVGPEYRISAACTSHAGTNHGKTPEVPALNSIRDGAIHRTMAAVASQLPSPHSRLPGIANAWHSNKTAPAYRTGPRRLSGANSHPPNSPIQPIPNHISPKERTSKLDTRNTANPKAASRGRSKWAAPISTTVQTKAMGAVIPIDKARRPTSITLRQG
jgi:hypothetical protein